MAVESRAERLRLRLVAVQSAMRDIRRTAPQLPGTETERREYLRERQLVALDALEQVAIEIEAERDEELMRLLEDTREEIQRIEP